MRPRQPSILKSNKWISANKDCPQCDYYYEMNNGDVCYLSKVVALKSSMDEVVLGRFCVCKINGGLDEYFVDAVDNKTVIEDVVKWMPVMEYINLLNSIIVS